MMMNKLYFPFYYLYVSRLKTKLEQISWIIIFIIPQLLVTHQYQTLSSVIFILLFFTSQVVFNSLYEIGYIENDVKTSKIEKKPTIRLNNNMNSFVEDHYLSLVNTRYFVVLFLLTFLLIAKQKMNIDLYIMQFVILLVVTRLVFLIHNKIRNLGNLFSFSILAITKYIFPVILFVPVNQLIFPVVLLFFLFPLIRIIEHSTHKRYGFNQYAKLIGNHDIFRIYYYLILLILSVILFIEEVVTYNDSLLTFMTIIYFFLFRLFSLFLIKKGYYIRSQEKSKDLLR